MNASRIAAIRITKREVGLKKLSKKFAFSEAKNPLNT